MTFGVFKHSSPNTGLVYRDCIWSLHVQRDPTYYIFKGAVPIYVIVAFAFFQFAMDVDAQLTERLNFLVALMLSSFAIQWTVTDRLPRVPFLTSLDRLICASLLALFMMALGCYHEPGRLQRQARRVRLRRYQTNPHVGPGVPGRDDRRLRGHAPSISMRVSRGVHGSKRAATARGRRAAAA